MPKGDTGRDGGSKALEPIRIAALVDCLMLNPTKTSKEVGAILGLKPWQIAALKTSDDFTRILKSRVAMVDPLVRMTLEDRMNGIAWQAVENIATYLEKPVGLDNNVKVLDIASKALGMQQNSTKTSVSINYVAHVPPKAKDAATWMAQLSDHHGVDVVSEQ